MLKARCASSLSGYKRPTSLLMLDAIPRNAVGKIDKSAWRVDYPNATQLS